MLTANLILVQLLSQNQLAINVNEEDAYWLAKNIYHEARGESFAGQFAVAHTTLNRVTDKKTIKQVVTQSVRDSAGRPLKNKCHFSWYCDGKPDDIKLYHNGKPLQKNIDSFELAATVAIMALSGVAVDNTAGATHYYNPSLANPRWASAFDTTKVYGNHKFMR